MFGGVCQDRTDYLLIASQVLCPNELIPLAQVKGFEPLISRLTAEHITSYVTPEYKYEVI